MKHVLITGGAGFIGTNLAHRLLTLGVRVRILDNLSRGGVEQNLEWLRQRHAALLDVRVGDVRSPADLKTAIAGIDQVFHFAAQVAVTSSISDPVADFEVNARGTLNVLEAIRRQPAPPGLIFTSTNKVYGALKDMKLQRNGTRYLPEAGAYRMGVDESRPLDFHSPYGCSKGAADQYILDYSRIYRIPAVVFRMSCIYGPHQFGNEDQGWVAHFVLRALNHRPIAIYGDGAQVRDILFIEDLLKAFLLAQANIERLSGRAFNIGGGPANTISLIELMRMLEALNRGTALRVAFEEWRSGDQRYYVSDYRAFQKATGWEPRVGVQAGIRRLHEWLDESRVPSAVAGVMQEA